MKRTACFLLAVGSLLIAPLVAQQMIAQEPAPIPPYSSDLLGPDLIAWTEQQKPQPIPARLPDPLAQQQEQTSTPTPEQSQPTSRTFI